MASLPLSELFQWHGTHYWMNEPILLLESIASLKSFPSVEPKSDLQAFWSIGSHSIFRGCKEPSCSWPSMPALQIFASCYTMIRLLSYPSELFTLISTVVYTSELQSLPHPAHFLNGLWLVQGLYNLWHTHRYDVNECTQTWTTASCTLGTRLQ